MLHRLAIIPVLACLALASGAADTLAGDSAAVAKPFERPPAPTGRPHRGGEKTPGASGATESISPPQGHEGKAGPDSQKPGALLNPCHGNPQPTWCKE
jgi:hypothetical protein